MGSRSVSDADRYLGTVLRQARLAAGKSMRECADLIDKTPQQLSKYEVGEDKVAASSFMALLAYLGAPLDPVVAGFLSRARLPAPVQRPRMTLELMAAFNALPPRRQQILLQVATALASDEDDPPAVPLQLQEPELLPVAA